jgi:hypothetical protein
MNSIISLGATMSFDDLKSVFGFHMVAYLPKLSADTST